MVVPRNCAGVDIECPSGAEGGDKANGFTIVEIMR
jgi:hypothetical protein